MQISWRMLLTGSLLRACSACFLRVPRTTNPERHSPQWGEPFSIHQSSIKRMCHRPAHRPIWCRRGAFPPLKFSIPRWLRLVSGWHKASTGGVSSRHSVHIWEAQLGWLLRLQNRCCWNTVSTYMFSGSFGFVVQTVLECLGSLPKLVECWDYRHVPPNTLLLTRSLVHGEASHTDPTTEFRVGAFQF